MTIATHSTARAGINFLCCLIFLFSALKSSTVFAQWWNPLAPETAEDCMLKNMGGVTSDEAAKMVTAACYNKYPSEHDLELRSGFVDGECNFTWSGSGFSPKAQLKDSKFVAYSITNERLHTDIVLWMPIDMINNWDKQKNGSSADEVRKLILTPEVGEPVVRQCRDMLRGSKR